MTHDEARFAGPIWHDPDDDHMHDECGIVGVFGHPEASTFAYLGLHALQHRGQESAGIVSHDGNVSFAHRAMGLVNENFGDPKVLKQLPGHAAIGQVRYSTAGGSRLKNAQPIAMDYTRGALALAHNGNFVNAFSMRAKLESEGSIFQSDSDTEVVAHLIAKGEGGPEERIVAALGQMRGAYSMVFLTENRLVAARDPRGWRPLILGQYEGAWIVASETCAFDLIGAEYLREIAPGEVLVIDKDGVRSSMPFPKAEPRLCVFEFVYFARPDSRIFNQDVHAIRQAFGRELAREHPADADLVMAVPDSGLPATIGFGHESGLPFDMGLIRSHYTGRTFIEPTQDIRLFGVRRKLNPNRAVLRGKRVVMVDDSIVRGNTMRKIMTMVREAGAKEIHVRISSPPVTWPCYYGIDTPTREELIGANKTPHEIAEFLGADSLGYLSIDGMKRVLNAHQAQAGHYCYACFNGDYPEPPDTENHRRQMHLFQANEASVEKG